MPSMKRELQGHDGVSQAILAAAAQMSDEKSEIGDLFVSGPLAHPENIVYDRPGEDRPKPHTRMEAKRCSMRQLP